jgi:hypothetical protein
MVTLGRDKERRSLCLSFSWFFFCRHDMSMAYLTADGHGYPSSQSAGLEAVRYAANFCQPYIALGVKVFDFNIASAS